MKVFLELICLPITILIWLLSFGFILIFSFNMFNKIKKGDKTLFEIFVDINYIVYRTYLIDFYLSINLYLRALAVVLIYTLFI